MPRYIRHYAIGFSVASIALISFATTARAALGNAARGAETYEAKCTGCHSIDANRIGPAHRGVFGRKAGLAPGFAYSPGVKNSRVIWNEVTLDKWLTNPQAFIPGARMGFRLADAAQRADVIAFLKTQTAKKK